MDWLVVLRDVPAGVRHLYLCTSKFVNGPDGRPTQLIPTDEGFIDYFGRPWADNWEKHFEQGWKKPEDGK